MKINLANRMTQYQAGIFTKLQPIIDQKRQQGDEIINLSIGSPDLPPHEMIRKTLATKSLETNQYGYTLTGKKEFNQAVANYYKRRSNVSLDPETEIIQTMGSQEGLIHLPAVFCNPGDIVLMTNPAYVAYEAGIHLAGAEPYALPLKKENQFLPDLTQIPKDILKRSKLLILNLPGNPVPAVPDENFFERVVAFAKKHNIIVLHDAAYSEFYFEGQQPISFLTTPDAKEVGMEINSLSKSFSMAGARIAYIAGNETLISAIKMLKSNLDYGVFAPIQEAGIVALNHAEEITDTLRAIFKERHDIVTVGLKKLGWEIAPSTGGMFVWAKYPFHLDDTSFVIESIKQTGVVFVPGSAFGSEGKGFVRIALVQEKQLLNKAISKLDKLIL